MCLFSVYSASNYYFSVTNFPHMFSCRRYRSSSLNRSYNYYTSAHYTTPNSMKKINRWSKT
ncbi:uncharacterized protein CANTADRAFT_259773 [Suhomyces tanzawaensis NRRL Y-17324]|uniref:Uncharacterized protein n=1 Tax=Suhomyces tanzawaensis NRRL Y-17324 TaxID=984487 RepID=A0A1E4SIZ1_9ASCO|nr:uncharacterized protein CANTADRAFT_259773 [Suhomyces tanzawaensis NRRL Y-17324]ODV79469.1 hypothetical protein CANTADRAFT_259773 [Suhomyces tanzawaensis NRRL Y-17324]